MRNDFDQPESRDNSLITLSRFSVNFVARCPHSARTFSALPQAIVQKSTTLSMSIAPLLDAATGTSLVTGHEKFPGEFAPTPPRN